jgi:hypothetical protein
MEPQTPSDTIKTRLLHADLGQTLARELELEPSFEADWVGREES